MSGASGAGRVVSGEDGTFSWLTGRTLFSFLQRMDTSLDSPSFPFAGATWSLSIEPDWSRNGWLGLSLRNEVLSPTPRLTVSLGVETTWGVRNCHRGETNFFGEFGVRMWLQQSDLVQRWREIAVDGRLIINCQLQRWVTQEEITPLPDSGIYSDRNFEEAAAEETEGSSNTLFKNLLSLSDSLKELFLSGEGSDVTIIVKEKEFRVHSSILRARSRVFSSMLTHDMIERNTGVVTIDDCDPGAFRELMQFMYTGRVEGLSSNNMFHVYYAADKYEVADLKLDCVKFMKRSMSLKTICSVLILAKTHFEQDLLRYATKYFVGNVDQILETVEWQNFVKDHPTESNELFIKALKTIRK